MVVSRAHSPVTRVLGMSAARFLREHWQKKPLLVRGAFPGMRDPLAPEELAGLSCEEGVESRIVRERGGREPWEVTFGPHPESRFASLPARGWTLLVQELNRHVPAAALLLEEFAFVPNVRVDDVMLSYAAPGGSVGPHLDSYDVFLIQGMGERRWRYDTRPTSDTRLRAGLDLRILQRFTPDADEVLRAGDLLYLPPGFAHHGVAVTPCLTYSVGFRAPGFAEMWKAFAAHAAARSGAEGARLLVDPPLVPAVNPGTIPPALLARVRDAVRSMDASDDAIDRFFASFATRLAPGHELTPPRKAPTEADILARLARGDAVVRSEEGRWAFLPRPRGALLLYLAGEELEVDAKAADLARALCAARRWDGRELAALVKNAAARALISSLVARGGLAFAGRASARASGRAGYRASGR
jgi:50S ribosomal protein L16 3-hydroxylase